MGGSMRFFRKRSKRTSTKIRVKQEKKLREHNRKLRADKRKNPEKYRKSKKDPGVPNECPFKEQVLKEAADIKDRKEREKEERRLRFKTMKEERNRARKEGTELKQDHQKMEDFVFPNMVEEAKNGDEDEENKTPFCDVDTIVGESDIILHILDARDPNSTLITKVPKLVGDQNKRIIYLLNKADLVPKGITKAWIKTLRFSHPAVAFKASKGPNSKCIGIPSLLSTLKSLNSRNERLRVGIVGYPGTGVRSCSRSLQGKLTKKFELGEQCGRAMDARKGSVYGREDLGELKDPLSLFTTYIFPRFPRSAWLLRYNQSSFEGDDLTAWATQLGEDKIAEYIKDYREGGLRYFVKAPEGTKVKPTDEFGAEFQELPDVLEAESMELTVNPVTLRKKKAPKEVAEEDSEQEETSEQEAEEHTSEDEDSEEEEEEPTPPSKSPNGRGKKRKMSPAVAKGKKKKRRT